MAACAWPGASAVRRLRSAPVPHRGTWEEPMPCRVRFNQALPIGNEIEYICRAISNLHISGDGPFTKRCEALLEQALGAPRVLLTTSGTHALEIAALLLDLHAGDEVIVPSFTFPSTANAFVLRGATPVFIDIREDTLNLNEALLGELISPRTRAIFLGHYAGVACDMDAISRVARAFGIRIVEDGAHGLFGRYRGKPLGTFGELAALSFHETKNITCGEGGAVVINDPQFVGRAEIIREKGTNRSQFFRGEVGEYGWMDVGSSYVPSDILAAFLCAQLERQAEIQSRRSRVWLRYADALQRWAFEHSVRLPSTPPDSEIPYHLFYLIMPDPESRERFLSHLKRRGVHAVFHYLPLHTSAMGRRLGGRPGQCPVTEMISERLVRLPFYTGMTEAVQTAVIGAVTAFSP